METLERRTIRIPQGAKDRRPAVKRPGAIRAALGALTLWATLYGFLLIGHGFGG
jgi:hypothetical protein